MSLTEKSCVLAGDLGQSLSKGVGELGVDALEILERKVAHSLSFIRETLNYHRDIHRLPAEVLGMIFRYALPPTSGFCESGSHPLPDMQKERQEKMAISHVCRRWRSIALQMASLWTVIDASSGPWASACFERSRSMPLHIFASYPLDKTTVASLASQESRIRALFLFLPSPYRSSTPMDLPAMLPPVPDLECLVLETQSRNFEEGRPMVDFTQLAQLFPRPPPRLTMLILKNQCWFPAIPYDALTHLHIAQGTPIDACSLLTLLGHCTALEKLVIVDVYLANARQVPEDYTVELPHLRLLTLGINQSRLWMRYLLKGLKLPPTVIVRISGAEAIRALTQLQPFPTLAFTATFDTLVVDCGPKGWIIQAAGPSSGLFLDLGQCSAARMVDFWSGPLSSLVPFKRLTRLVLGYTRPNFPLPFKSMPSLVSASIVLHSLPDSPMDTELVAQRLGVVLRTDATCFQWVSEFELWSSSSGLSCVREVGFLFPRLKKFTFYHPGSDDLDDVLAAEWAELQESMPNHDVVLRSIGGTDEPMLALPGVPPVYHAYEW
ncbi:hypothetical protein BD414DRAFT_537942 [Trametes punicea]|nr:hypothetical protein BD414DRAFT_537942 [Trametes punicea]